MEIEKQNIIAAQNVNIFQKDEVNKNRAAKSSPKNNRLKSLFSSMLSDAVNADSDDDAISSAMWTDNYMEDNVKQELDAIGNLGRRIKKSQNYDDVSEYKRRIQSFLKNALDRSEALKTRESGSRFRGTITLKTRIEIINKELNELTREFMKTQMSVINIAASIDKIQGLLINLEL